MSGEHFISKAVLELFANANNQIVASGFPWATTSKLIAPANLEANVLCKRHNHALSPLDAFAHRLFKFILAATTVGAHATACRAALFNGHDFERWVLKVLLGAIASGNASDRNAVPIQKEKPPRHLLDVLFYGMPLPQNAGLYFIPPDVTKPTPFQAKVEFAPMINDESRIYGAMISVNDLVFRMFMYPVNDGGLVNQALRRVEEFAFATPRESFLLLFRWKDGSDPRQIAIDVRPANMS